MKLIDFIEAINRISITNFRISITIICMLIVIIDYVVNHHPVDINLLVFLGAMAGIDVAHYTAKRTTQVKMMASLSANDNLIVEEEETEENPASTDIQELSNTNIG